MTKLQTGFTIIELMIVIAVIGVLAAVAMPFMRDTILNQRVRSAVSDAHLSLLLARSEAIKRNTDINMQKTGATWDLGWNVWVTNPDATVSILRTRQAVENITVACNTDTDTAPETCPDLVTFNRTGRSASMIEYRFYLTGNARVFARCVRLSVSGVPRVVIDQDGDPDNGCD